MRAGRAAGAEAASVRRSGSVKAPRESDWSRVTSSEAEWRAFCGAVGLRFLARAARRVTHDGESIAQAVNATIASEADDMRDKGAPPELVERFVLDYTRERAHQMTLVSDWVQSWRGISEGVGAKPSRRKRASRPLRSSS